MKSKLTPLDYFRARMAGVPFNPYPWAGEDKNIGAFRSREEFVAWYGQPPGIDNQPYRDRGFYTRELAYVSQSVQPRTVVEFGTCQGIGTCILRWLNPGALLTTVDVNAETYMPGNQKVPIGHLAKHQGFDCNYELGNSWDYSRNEAVDLCFIDGDHSYAAVVKDTDRAWLNRSFDRAWAIVWHDYNERHPGVMRAVNEFCAEVREPLRKRYDSDTVWITGTE